MDLQEVNDVLERKDLREARRLLRQFDDLISAQTRHPLPDPEGLRRAAQLLTTAINDGDERVDVIALAELFAMSAPKAAISAVSNSRAVALLTDRDLLTEQDGVWHLTTARFGDVKELCPTERFFARPVSTPATAFLVREDLVVTLRHSLSFFSGLDKIRVIFDFEMQDPAREDSCKLDFSAQEIYEVTERYSLVDDGPHAFVALRLSRPVVDRAPVECNFGGSPIGASQPVYLIGHPCGLPKIHAGNAVVLDASSAEAFTANLDAYIGNSSAPVFNEATGQVEGVLAEGGEHDFQWIPNGAGGFCNYSIVYKVNEPFGYKVVRIQKLRQLLRA